MLLKPSMNVGVDMERLYRGLYMIKNRVHTSNQQCRFLALQANRLRCDQFHCSVYFTDLQAVYQFLDNDELNSRVMQPSPGSDSLIHLNASLPLPSGQHREEYQRS